MVRRRSPSECTLCQGKKLSYNTHAAPAINIKGLKYYSNLKENHGPVFRVHHFWCDDCTISFFEWANTRRNQLGVVGAFEDSGLVVERASDRPDSSSGIGGSEH